MTASNIKCTLTWRPTIHTSDSLYFRCDSDNNYSINCHQAYVSRTASANGLNCSTASCGPIH